MLTAENKSNFIKFILWWKLNSGLEFIEIYGGGSEYADLVKSFTGIHKQAKVSVPGNQIFVKYEISSTVARRKGFTAFIQRIGISSYYGRGAN